MWVMSRVVTHLLTFDNLIERSTLNLVFFTKTVQNVHSLSWSRENIEIMKGDEVDFLWTVYE